MLGHACGTRQHEEPVVGRSVTGKASAGVSGYLI
jgi:hypothetical protein